MARISKQLSYLKSSAFSDSKVTKKYFDLLKHWMFEHKLLLKKREVLHEVINSINLQNLKKAAFESIFTYVIKSQDEILDAQKMLVRLKKKRIF